MVKQCYSTDICKQRLVVDLGKQRIQENDHRFTSIEKQAYRVIGQSQYKHLMQHALGLGLVFASLGAQSHFYHHFKHVAGVSGFARSKE